MASEHAAPLAELLKRIGSNNEKIRELDKLLLNIFPGKVSFFL